MALEQETAYFESEKSDLLEHHRGQYVLIHDHDMLGAFPRFEDAFAAGIREIGNKPFLVKQVNDQPEQVQFPALCLGLLSAHT